MRNEHRDRQNEENNNDKTAFELFMCTQIYIDTIGMMQGFGFTFRTKQRQQHNHCGND